MSWRSNWATKAYVADAGPLGDRYRVLIRADRGQVVRFTVQLEVWIEGRYRPAIRYDSAHGFPHRDTLDWDGRGIDKLWLPVTPMKVALNDAIRDVKANWSVYRQEFERRKP